MKTVIRTLQHLPLLLALCMAEAAGAEAGFDASVAAGYQYDNNVNVVELDASTGEADAAWITKLDLGARLPLSERVTTRLGYGYANTAYEQFSQFDLAIHQGRAEIDYRAGRFTHSLSLLVASADLDESGFLDIRQISPSLSFLFGDHWYLRTAYIGAQKNYADAPERDASSHSLSGDLYWLIDGLRRYVSVGLRLDREDARGAEFDFGGLRAQASYGQTLGRGRLQLEVKARLQAEARNYGSPTESIGELRRDKRYRAGLSAQLPLGEHFRLEGRADYRVNRSNLRAADFDETVYSLSLAAVF